MLSLCDTYAEDVACATGVACRSAPLLSFRCCLHSFIPYPCSSIWSCCLCSCWLSYCLCSCWLSCCLQHYSYYLAHCTYCLQHCCFVRCHSHWNFTRHSSYFLYPCYGNCCLSCNSCYLQCCCHKHWLHHYFRNYWMQNSCCLILRYSHWLRSSCCLQYSCLLLSNILCPYPIACPVVFFTVCLATQS